jgi:AsmA family
MRARTLFMQEIDPNHAQSDRNAPRRRSRLRRFVMVYYVLLAFLLLALIPPYISVNRFQRRIATSISQSLGRPVHLDHVTLNLLPLPGFTLENLVVSEDPAFGNEPVIRANSVQARLRVSSLWSRRVEFSTISFTEPSVNLVRLPNGKWNMESILLQAAHIDAAPTAQKSAGATPRFPYIEATGARVNLKLGQEKIPLSLLEAEFALWLPNPQEWRVRIKAVPTRTDTSASDTGEVRIEGTLARAASLNEVPIDLQGEWRGAPLGEASRVLLGRDEGLRGEMTLTAKVLGTVGNNKMQTRVQLNAVRRAEFVPEQPLSIDLECLATATETFRSFSGIQCSWPPASSSSTQTLVLTGTIPDVRRLDAATLKIDMQGIPAGTILDWLHVASARVPADVSAEGMLVGRIAHDPDPTSGARWDGSIHVTGASLKSPLMGLVPITVGDVLVQPATRGPQQASRSRKRAVPILPGDGFLLAPTSLALGGKDPATIDGRFDSKGYTLHLTGMVVLSRLVALGNAIPQLGDGMKEVLPTNRAAGPVRVDLTATRPWGGTQEWQDGTVYAAASHAKRGTRSAQD